MGEPNPAIPKVLAKAAAVLGAEGMWAALAAARSEAAGQGALGAPGAPGSLGGLLIRAVKAEKHARARCATSLCCAKRKSVSRIRHSRRILNFC